MSTENKSTGVKRALQWRDSLERATTYDSWGQLIEAIEEYEKIIKSIRIAIGNVEIQFSDEQAKFLNHMSLILSARAKAVLDLSVEPTIKLQKVKAFISTLEKIALEDGSNDLPVDQNATLDAKTVETREALIESKRTSQMSTISNTSKSVEPPPVESDAKSLKSQPSMKQPPAAVPAVAATPAVEKDEDDEAGEVQGVVNGNGTLQPRQKWPSGKTNIRITIDKIKLKDPSQYLSAFFTVSVYDAAGKLLPGGVQDTPPTKLRDEYIHFRQDVDLQVPLEDLPEGFAVYLEFKHFKPKKKIISTKCFSILELDEIKQAKEALTPLEIYSKPVDYKRKKLNLLTEKPFFLFVSITLTRT